MPCWPKDVPRHAPVWPIDPQPARGCQTTCGPCQAGTSRRALDPAPMRTVPKSRIPRLPDSAQPTWWVTSLQGCGCVRRTSNVQPVGQEAAQTRGAHLRRPLHWPIRHASWGKSGPNCMATLPPARGGNDSATLRGGLARRCHVQDHSRPSLQLRPIPFPLLSPKLNPGGCNFSFPQWPKTLPTDHVQATSLAKKAPGAGHSGCGEAWGNARHPNKRWSRRRRMTPRATIGLSAAIDWLFAGAA